MHWQAFLWFGRVTVFLQNFMISANWVGLFFLIFRIEWFQSLVNQKKIVLVITFAQEDVLKRVKILVRNNWRALSKCCTLGVSDTKVQVPRVMILNSKKIKSTWMPLTLFILHIINGESPPSHFCKYVLNIGATQWYMALNFKSVLSN